MEKKLQMPVTPFMLRYKCTENVRVYGYVMYEWGYANTKNAQSMEDRYKVDYDSMYDMSINWANVLKL